MDTPGFSKRMDRLGRTAARWRQAAPFGRWMPIIAYVTGSEPPVHGQASRCWPACAKNAFVWSSPPGSQQNRVLAACAAYQTLLNQYAATHPQKVQVLMVSARTGKHCQQIVTTLLKHLPQGPAYYDADALTDQRLRELR
ncbi:MAG: hypothetical protein U0003_05965 [Vampirovibrionales bacterium]